MSVVVKCDWGLKFLKRGKEVPLGPQYLYSGTPKAEYVGRYWWGDDHASARRFDTLEEAQEFVTRVWGPDKVLASFEFLDSETKEVIATDARDSQALHATEEGEGRSSSPVATE